MLKMAQIQYIKHLYETEDKSLREISRITSHSFNTVKKYAYQDNWSPDNLPNIDPQNYPTLGPFIPIIDEWLDNDRRVPRKQRHTISRIFKRLCDEKGFTGSYSSVKKYVRKKRFIDDQASAGFIPLMQPKAHAQADFGEFTFYTPEGNSRMDRTGHHRADQKDAPLRYQTEFWSPKMTHLSPDEISPV